MMMVDLGAALALLLLLGAGARWWSIRAGGRRAGRSRTPLGLGERVLVAVSHPVSGQSLGEVASALARSDAGRVSALTVLSPGDVDDVLSLSREAIRRCEAVVVEDGIRAGGRLRVDTSVAAGILHETVESDASLLILGWPRLGADGRLPLGIADAVAGVPCPLLLARLQGYQWRRIVLRVPATPTPEGLRASLRLATDVADRLAHQHRLPVVCLPATEPATADPAQLIVTPVDACQDAVDRALRDAAPLGDELLALCHGPRAGERRELLSTAANLYAPPTTDRPEAHA